MYSINGMLTVDLSVALKCFQDWKIEVYLIYSDNTEALAHSKKQIKDHYDHGGELGVYKYEEPH